MAIVPLTVIENKTILTPTGGFLGTGFTHTVNFSHGCPFAHSLCGEYCYAQHNHWITRGRPWGLYGYKENVLEPYRREYDSIKRPRRGEPKPGKLLRRDLQDQKRTLLRDR
jgi:hypothetical protein